MFVEVLVVGIGSFAALAGFVVAIAGYGNLGGLAPIFSSAWGSGLAIAFSYALGILVDRGADQLLKPARRNLRRQHFSSNAAFDQARRIVGRSADLMARADYARSRMRVCRGWLLNSVLIAFVVDLIIIRSSFPDRLLLVFLATVMGVLLALGFYAAWRSITVTGYKKLAQQSQPTVPGQQAFTEPNLSAGSSQS
ncbi:hypothetical protein ACR3S4_05530 [Streptomyces sp. CH8.1]|uniref:hypothetical protein n=1 Tax=Streptomyces sp. CH8.1 TaxID=3439546 RepID=UPI003DA19509